jgi:curved DNA-binding protein CbpA
MKSAYHVLGVPGNANAEDIDIAYRKAQLHYSPERMANDASVAERFAEVRNAYQILRDAESRAAHDRKLAHAGTPVASRAPRTVVVVTEEVSWFSRPLFWLIMVVVLLFAGGTYISNKREDARKEVAAKELALKKQQDDDAEKDRQLQLAAERSKQQAQIKAENDERRLRYDAQNTAARAEYATRAAQDSQSSRYAAEQREAQRREYEQRAQRDRETNDARQRVEADKRRIRELCYQQYRRADC